MMPQPVLGLVYTHLAPGLEGLCEWEDQGLGSAPAAWSPQELDTVLLLSYAKLSHSVSDLMLGVM